MAKHARFELARVFKSVAIWRRLVGDLDYWPKVSLAERVASLRKAEAALPHAIAQAYPNGMPERPAVLDVQAHRASLDQAHGVDAWLLWCLELLVCMAAVSGDDELAALGSPLGTAIGLGQPGALSDEAARLPRPWSTLAAVAEHELRGEGLLARPLAQGLLSELEAPGSALPRLTDTPRSGGTTVPPVVVNVRSQRALGAAPPRPRRRSQLH
jgi:hypothetical protein